MGRTFFIKSLPLSVAIEASLRLFESQSLLLVVFNKDSKLLLPAIQNSFYYIYCTIMSKYKKNIV